MIEAIRNLPNRTTILPAPRKQFWLGWLAEYDGPGFYGRQNPNRSAQFIFNKLNSAESIIWLAEASGVEIALLQKALRVSRREPHSKQAAAAAVRAVIPWSLVESRLRQLTVLKVQRHFLAYHNTDKRGSYEPKGSHGTFVTSKNYRAETLQGQYLWAFEGRGSPKVYRLASHGTITNVFRDADGEATITFKIEGARTPAIVSTFPWFRALLAQQRSFANGFSPLNDAAAIHGLEQLVERLSAGEAKAESVPTTTEALIDARLGQGRFRAALEREWDGSCAVTGCSLLQMLRASHIKPWEASTDAERLDSQNGLLLSAHLDALFDKGLLTFDDDGKMLLSSQISAKDRMYFRLPKSLRARPDRRRRRFLDYHRNHRFEA
ncbi:HNH endonuclease signature motif containing protein [Bradyrhizobium sp.]|uniref:HNH endonuclease n=1 Tax=Bradyrhizobium sp. TaxID=376 RepID=UPI002DDD38B8|nr:HNH endonuclease signature motif containing protein [Bradyrhizobium sp.]HEV2156177.1 HNH endonuclease signature motif containing protein [Bradyrhizobium sp.]